MRKASRSDRPAIAKFIEEAYGTRAQYKATPRWTWQFIDNPFGPTGGDEVPVWIAVDGDRVVGQIAVQNGLLQVDGKTLEAGWALDIMILPVIAGSGIGHRLHEAVVNEVDVLMALTMADASRRMAQSTAASRSRMCISSPGGCDWILQPSSATCWCATATHRRAHEVGTARLQRLSVPPGSPGARQPASPATRLP